MADIGQQSAGRAAAPTFPRLVTVEFRRLLLRRFTRVTLMLCAIGFLAAVAVVWATHSSVTPTAIAQATAQRDAELAKIQLQVHACAAQHPTAVEEHCGYVPSPEQFTIDRFLHPFEPSSVGSSVLVVAVACAMASFIIAATFIGAEWSSKNLISWLFYEPRRFRLMGAKLAALCGLLLPLALLAQLAWWIVAKLLLAYRGEPVSALGNQAAHFWSNLIGVQIRGALLVLPVALIAFALANMMRNTAASLGVAFVYLAIVESAARAFSPQLQPYLLTNAATSWISHGGITVFGAPTFNQQQGTVMPQAIHLSNLHGAIVLTILTVALLGASLQIFRRRDIT